MKEGGKATSYQYDLLNRQTSVQMPDGRVQENLYDGEGLRAGIRECGKLSTFLYYNGEILAEGNGESMPLRRRLLGMSSLQTLEDGQYHACHQDEKGSTIYITGRDGAVENCYAYDAFGNSLKKKEGIQNRIQYTGQQYDQETGQYYLRARYYNPAVGRFTQEDTYRGDGLNLYAYCKNNPVVYYDPSGHDQAVNPSNGTEMTNTAGVEKGNSSIDNKGGSDTTRVGRWMSQEEYDKMISSGKVQMSGDNKVHVANPADINAFGRQAPKGSIYVEFDVPSNTISGGGKDGWGIINGPGSLLDRVNAKKGLPRITEMPDATNISIEGRKII